MKSPILSLCIPTWNRATFLNEGLKRLENQLNSINPDDIEIFVSDNCSTDNTSFVVQDYINKGMPIVYNRNDENLGPDGNFYICMQRSHGQFIWLVGDDDFLIEGALYNIIETLKLNSNIGLMHISNRFVRSGFYVFDKLGTFLNELTYWSTFITSNIFNRDALNLIKDTEKYKGTYIFQLPFYLAAAMSHALNIMYYEKVFEDGADSSRNGGYNYFKVFVKNYLDIWFEFIKRFNVDISVYRYIKKDIFRRFHLYYIHLLLVRKKNIALNNHQKNGRKGFYIEDSWKILNHYYGKEWYSIPFFILWEIKNSLRFIKHKLF